MAKINIVLFHPEIPQNTANIIRTAVALDATLHLIKPYGFDLDLSKKVFKRSSANYLELVSLVEYDDFNEFIKIKQPKNIYFLTRYGKKIYNNIKFNQDEEQVFYVFGSESQGIGYDILKKFSNQTFRIPMKKTMRSLNLANCVALVSYHAAAQQDFVGLEFSEPHKDNYWNQGE